MTDTIPDLTIPGPAFYPRPTPSLNIRQVGDGPRCYAVWLDTWPVFLDGLEGLPHIGDRFEIDGKRCTPTGPVSGATDLRPFHTPGR